MAPFATLPVSTNGDATLATDLTHSVDEALAIHNVCNRTLVSYLSSGNKDISVLFSRAWSHAPS